MKHGALCLLVALLTATPVWSAKPNPGKKASRVTSAPVPAVVGTASQGAAGRAIGLPSPITSM